MGGKASRSKGSSAEREIVQILKSRGHNARRSAYSGMMAHEKGDIVGLTGYHLEVKRCEKLKLPEWTRQAESGATDAEVPVVVYRASREPWRVSMPLNAFLDLVEDSAPLPTSQKMNIEFLP